MLIVETVGNWELIHHVSVGTGLSWLRAECAQHQELFVSVCARPEPSTTLSPDGTLQS